LKETKDRKEGDKGGKETKETAGMTIRNESFQLNFNRFLNQHIIIAWRLSRKTRDKQQEERLWLPLARESTKS
jgi:hypothetical protein